MRKLFLCACVLLAWAGSAAAARDHIIPPAKLPRKAQAFIAATFPNVSVAYAERDDLEYEVRLGDGTQIKFSLLGAWQEIKSLGGIPASVLPANAASQLAASHPEAAIVQVEKDDGYLQVQLAGGLEVYFHRRSGQLLGQKWDD